MNYNFEEIPPNWRIVLPPKIQKDLLKKIIKIKGKCGVVAKELGISWSSLNRYRRCEVLLPKRVFISLCEKVGYISDRVYSEYSNHSVNFLYKRKIDKEKRLKEILAYVNGCIKRKYYPTGKTLHRKFRIYSMNLNLKKIYSQLGVNLLLLPKKPSRSKEEIKKLLVQHIKEEVSKDHFPSRRELNRNFI